MLSTIDLINIINNDHLTKKIFKGVFARDQLPTLETTPACFIINTDPISKEGEHWLAFYIDKDQHCNFFDSYGNHPSKFKLDAYLNKNFKSWTYNNIQIQGLSSYCGYYAALFILYAARNKTRDYYLEFNNLPNLNDQKLGLLIKKFS
jgi:hypothetical protein